MRLQEEVRLKTPAKIDLGLGIFFNHRIGTYGISSIMQSVGIFDDVIVRKSAVPGFRIFCNDKELEKNKEGYIYNFVKCVLEKCEIKNGIIIKLFRRIPNGIDLGEDGSDCVAILKGLIKLFGVGLSKYQILKLCMIYGRDVVFNYTGGTMFIGHNNSFKHLLAVPRSFVLIAETGFSFSSEYVLKKWQEKKMRSYDKKSEILTYAIKNHRLKSISRNLYNDLETIIYCLDPKTRAIRNLILENGALGVNLNGFGKCIFGFFGNFDKTHKVGELLKSKFPENKIFITRTINDK